MALSCARLIREAVRQRGGRHAGRPSVSSFLLRHYGSMMTLPSLTAETVSSLPPFSAFGLPGTPVAVNLLAACVVAFSHAPSPLLNLQTTSVSSSLIAVYAAGQSTHSLAAGTAAVLSATATSLGLSFVVLVRMMWASVMYSPDSDQV